MKKLMFTLACAASAAVMAKLQTTATFEAFTAATTDTAGTMAKALAAKDDANTDNGSKYWELVTGDSADDASVVTAYATPPADDNQKYLKLETNGDELQRNVNNGGAAAAVGDGLYIDTLVQFTATPTAPENSSVGDDAKLAIWLEGEETYTLKARGMAFASSEWTSKDFALTFSGKSIEPDTWYRLVVRASADAFPSFGETILGEETVINGFQVIIDGTVATVTGVFDAETLGALADAKPGYNYNQWIPSISQEAGDFELTSVGFQGSGAIDNVEITDVDPLAVAPVEFTLTINFADGVNAVSYTVGNDTKQLTSSGTVKIAQDATVSIAVTDVVADWFVVPETATTVVMDADNKAVTVTATPAFNVNVPQGTAAETVSAALVWAKNAGKTTTAAANAPNLLNSYLLNVDDLTVDPQIKIVEIDLSGDVPAVTAEVTDANGTTIKTLTTVGDDKINASIKYKAAATLEDLKAATPKAAIQAGDQFIQVVVE